MSKTQAQFDDDYKFIRSAVLGGVMTTEKAKEWIHIRAAEVLQGRLFDEKLLERQMSKRANRDVPIMDEGEEDE